MQADYDRFNVKSLPPVYDTEYAAAVAGSQYYGLDKNEKLDQPQLLDTKGENEIARNLEKLKEDLKN